MNRLELPTPTETNDGQFWHAGKAAGDGYEGRDVRVHYVRSTRSWVVVVVGFTGLNSRRIPLKTAGGVRGRLGALFNAQAVHLTGWVR